MTYETVWYNGWIEPPGYFPLDAVEGDSPQEALLRNLEQLTQQVRQMFNLDNWTDSKIQETLYVLRADALVSLHTVTEAT